MDMACQRELRELVKCLEKAGFVRGGKESHRNYAHPMLKKPLTLSGHDGEDAKHYQEKAVATAIKEVQK